MRQNGRLRVRAVPVPELTPATVDAMWRLYRDHYDHVDRTSFDRDLSEKTLAFLGTDEGSAEVVGFSTALFYRHRHGGRWGSTSRATPSSTRAIGARRRCTAA